MSSSISYDSLWAGFCALDGSEQHKFFHAALKQLLGKPPRKGAAKKEPTGGAVGGAGPAPAPRKTNWWTEATKRAMPLLKPILEEVNEGLIRDGFKKYRISCVTQFLGGLKERGDLSADSFPADDVLEVRFKTFLVEYGKTHMEVVVPAATESEGEAGGSAASAGSKGSKKSKFSDLSPEEQKAARSERAKKAAATRAANKAAKASEE